MLHRTRQTVWCRASGRRRRTSGPRGPQALGLCLPAIMASAIVNADDASAPRTPIPRLLRGKESLYAVLLDLVQVLDHAHAVFCSVSPVQTLQAVTRNILALETKSCALPFENLTGLDPASDARDGLASVWVSATRALIPFSQVR